MSIIFLFQQDVPNNWTPKPLQECVAFLYCLFLKCKTKHLPHNHLVQLDDFFLTETREVQNFHVK